MTGSGPTEAGRVAKSVCLKHVRIGQKKARGIKTAGERGELIDFDQAFTIKPALMALTDTNMRLVPPFGNLTRMR